MGAPYSNVLLKLFLIGFLVLILMIPMFFTTLLIDDRQGRQREAETEIHQTWGGPQTVAGLMVTVPFDRLATDSDGREVTVRQVLRLLPERLEVGGDLTPQIRRRGNFETPVYLGNLTLDAQFKLPDPQRLYIDPARVHWREARVLFGVTDLRGLDGSPTLVWEGQTLELEADSDPHGPFAQALVARLDTLPEFRGAVGEAQSSLVGHEAQVRLTLALRGAGQLNVLPLGRESRVSLASQWSDPKFRGSFLPSNSTVADTGFEAQWSIPQFARSYPQVWFDDTHNHALDGSAFGVELLLPVDFYQRVSRCSKYAILFIGLTFAVFCLFEILQGLRIHPIQYGMVGFAMCLFYLLLLAFSEHLGFAVAYLVAASATVGLITAYSATVLRTRGRTTILGLNLVLLYGVLYVLVQLQTYALLVGAIGLFLVLAASMYLTRNIDWYNLGSGRGSMDEPLEAT